MLKTKKWKINLEFEWNAWEKLNENQIKILASNLISPSDGIIENVKIECQQLN